MKIAVIGSGVSGLAATWLLNEHSAHEVHLFESEDRPGGHANTVEFVKPDTPDAKPVKIDRAFLVFNLATYPNFSRFLSGVGIKWKETGMSFSISRDRGAFEWASESPLQLFCQPSNLFKPTLYRMMWDIFRFNSQTTAALQRGEVEFGGLSLGDYLKREQYSDAFVNDYILPMTASIWSTPPNLCALDFPARHLIRFMYNHHLLQLFGKPPWLTVVGGSEQYVNRIVSRIPEGQLHLNTAVHSVKTVHQVDQASDPKVVITTQVGDSMTFDHVIMACHSDITQELLNNGGLVTDMEEKILAGVSWIDNEVVVHNDTELMPIRKSAWSCWNFLTSSSLERDGSVKSNSDQVSVTFDMNKIFHIPHEEHGPVFVTVNPPFSPSKKTIVSRKTFTHPVFTAQSVWAQSNLDMIQNKRGITFAGAWTKYGFHEDGFTSGMRVVTRYLGVEPPFKIMDAQRPIEKSDGGDKLISSLEEIRRVLSVLIFVINGWVLGLIVLLIGEKKISL